MSAKTRLSKKRENRIREIELGLKVMVVCSYCSHGKWIGGRLSCDRQKTPCHSQRVRRWLREIDKLKET